MYFNYNSIETLKENLRKYFVKFLLDEKLYFLTFTFPEVNLTDVKMILAFENYLERLIFLDEKNHQHKAEFFWISEYGAKNSHLHIHMISNVKSFKGNHFFMSKDWNKFLLNVRIDSPSIRITEVNDLNIIDYVTYLFKDYEKGFYSKVGQYHKHYGLSTKLYEYFNSHNSLLEERIKQRFNTIFKPIKVGNINMQKNLGFIN